MSSTAVGRGVLGSCLLLLAGCGSSNEQNAGDAITHVLTAVKSGDGTLTAQLRPGALPTGSGPTVGASTSGAVLPGGSNIVAVTAGSNIDRVLVGVEGSDGYWELSGLGAAAAQSIILTFGQTAPSTFSLLFAGGSGGGVGPQAMVPVTLTPVGTGDVQVTVTWDADSDLDLHVVEPSGEEIFYGHPVSATGGQLDLDSNAGCTLDHKRAENITWPTGKAPVGGYFIIVDHWSACSQAVTKYVITLHINRRGTLLLAGPRTAAVTVAGSTSFGPYTFTGAGDEGSACWSGAPIGSADGTVLCGEPNASFTVQ